VRSLIGNADNVHYDSLLTSVALAAACGFTVEPVWHGDWGFVVAARVPGRPYAVHYDILFGHEVNDPDPAGLYVSYGPDDQVHVSGVAEAFGRARAWFGPSAVPLTGP
jgi:hypothetical protein